MKSASIRYQAYTSSQLDSSKSGKLVGKHKFTLSGSKDDVFTDQLDVTPKHNNLNLNESPVSPLF